jgi:hypothetical protein
LIVVVFGHAREFALAIRAPSVASGDRYHAAPVA